MKDKKVDPTPGDPDYYDFVTKTGKYKPKIKLPEAKPKQKAKKKKQSGLGLTMGQKMSGSGTNIIEESLKDFFK